MAGIAALAVAYVMSQFYRSFLAVLTPVLTAEIGMTKAMLALASGAWFVAFALSQFAVGIWLDRYGPRRTCALLLGLFGAGGAMVFAAADGPWWIVVAMGLIGIGCSPVLMGALYIFAHDFAPARFAVLTSLVIAFGSAGNVIGTAPMAGAVSAFGWRPTMLAFGGVTVLTAVLIAWLVRDPQARGSGSTGMAGYAELLRMPVFLPIVVLIAVIYAPATGVRGLWAGPYLVDMYGADTILIGNVTLVMALSMVAGPLIYGPLDTLFRTRKWVAMACGLVCVATLAILALQPQAGIGAATVLLVSIGLSAGAYGLLMAHARAFFPPHLIGRGATLMNFFSIGGAGVMQVATGAVVTAASDPARPAAAYSALFGFYALVIGAALCIYLFSTDAPPERP